MKRATKITGADFLGLALYAFAGVGLELLLVGVIDPLFGVSMETYTTAQSIVHWILTCLIWFAVGVFLIRLAKQRYDFDLFKKANPLKAWQYAVIIVCFTVTILVSYLSWDGFKVILEFQHNGALLFVFQYIYYVFEAFLFSLIIIFGQKACELWFKNENIPYGGIILGLTWGLGHIFSKGSISIGLLGMVVGFFYGAVYLLVNRDYKKALPIITLMFIL